MYIDIYLWYIYFKIVYLPETSGPLPAAPGALCCSHCERIRDDLWRMRPDELHRQSRKRVCKQDVNVSVRACDRMCVPDTISCSFL